MAWPYTDCFFLLILKNKTKQNKTCYLNLPLCEVSPTQVISIQSLLFTFKSSEWLKVKIQIFEISLQIITPSAISKDKSYLPIISPFQAMIYFNEILHKKFLVSIKSGSINWSWSLSAFSLASIWDEKKHTFSCKEGKRGRESFQIAHTSNIPLQKCSIYLQGCGRRQGMHLLKNHFLIKLFKFIARSRSFLLEGPILILVWFSGSRYPISSCPGQFSVTLAVGTEDWLLI